MENKRIELTDDTKVRIYNEYGGTAYYITDNARRSFAPGTSKEVTLKELKELVFEKGHIGLFQKGYLMIRDERVRELFGLKPLGKYNLDEKGMRALLETNDLEKIEDFLQYTSDANLDKLIRVAVEKPIQDLNTINLLQAYTNVKIFDLINERKEEQAASGRARRVASSAPDEPTTPVRRRITPKV